MSAAVARKLSLPQKRYIQQHKDDPAFKGYQDKIRAIVGNDIVVEFDWASVEEGLLTDNFENMFLNNGNNIKEWWLQNCEEGLKLVCADKIGKEAIQESIKKIVLMHTRDGQLSMKDGVFYFASNLHGNGCPGKDTVRDFLNENL